jgi:uncharacterized repeat protein (TIGR01451 family)
MSRRPQRTKRPTRQSKARRLSLESLEARELLSGMTVTSTADNPSDPVSGTLRYAINYFNTHPDIGGNTIDFDIPGTGVQTINLSAALPTITSTSTLVIDGTDQPGYSSSPLIEINGSGAGAGANGLTVSAGSGGYIRGLSIVGFTSSNTGQGGAAIYLEGTAASETIEGDYIGIEPDGSTAKANSSGIVVATANNTIGGTTAGSSNVISGNTNAGLLLVGSGAKGNLIQGNEIGTNAAGTSAVGNNYGVLLAGAVNNTIGGTISGASNVISGNTGPDGTTGIGVLFEGTASGDVIEGNEIGTDLTGSTAVPNVYGLYFGTPGKTTGDTVTNVTIGGTVTGSGNIISGNFVGITSDNITTSGVLIASNVIGLDASGTTAIPNSEAIDVYLATSTIGGTTAIAGNVISGSTLYNGTLGTGLVLNGVSDLVEGNYIGLTAAGTTGSGIGNVTGMVLDVVGSTIGGTTTGSANVIAGNSADAIDLNGTGGVAIYGNLIGEEANGTVVGNGGNGILVTISAPSTTPTASLALNDSIGGTTAGAGNIIAGNTGAGVIVNNAYPTGVTGLGIRSNVIKGNGKLGIDLPGTGVALPSTLYINGATVSGGSVTVSGVYFGYPSTSYSLDLYANGAAPSGYGQGPVYLGTVNVTTNASGFATFSPTYAEPSTAYTSFSATSTGPDGNTQEFSQNYPTDKTGSSAELMLMSTATSSTVTANSPFTLTETILNDGTSTANNVVLYDALPTSLVNLSVVTSATSGTATFDSNNVLTANIGSMTPGESITVTITATTSLTGTFTDQPGVSSTTYDPNYSDNFASQTITVNPAVAPTADLGVSETVSGSSTVGSPLTYTLTVTNYGPATATNATINDFLPSSVTFVSATPSQGAAASMTNSLVTDNLGTIASGATATLTIQVIPTAAGSITNSANVSGNQFDTNSSNNSTTLATTILAATPKIDLVLSQSVSSLTGVVGQNQIFTMTVTNHGPDAATNATLIDSLPTGVTFVNAAPTQGGPASLVNGVLTDNFGTIAAGASATLILTVTPTAPGFLLNYAGAYSADVAFSIAPVSFAYGAVTVPSGPSVIGLAKTNGNKQLVVAFDEALNASTATNKANYQLVSLGTTGTGPAKTVVIKSVSYNATTHLVTITPSTALSPTVYYKLVVVGSTKTGIADTLGRRLVNPQYSTPGANYSATFSFGTLGTY